jgi:hypothetical protein
MRPVRNVFQKLSRTEQRREGVVAYLWWYSLYVRTLCSVPLCTVYDYIILSMRRIKGSFSFTPQNSGFDYVQTYKNVKS